MDEKAWVTEVVTSIQPLLSAREPKLTISTGTRLLYAYEVRFYKGASPGLVNPAEYETDILVSERLSEDEWIPRVVIEAKLDRVTTHDAITYSEKALAHKTVHPYLRYGILLGNCRHYFLPGRLYRHGAYFDFMLSWVGCRPTSAELSTTVDLILDEVHSSKLFEEILYSSRKPDRQKFTVLQRRLVLNGIADR